MNSHQLKQIFDPDNNWREFLLSQNILYHIEKTINGEWAVALLQFIDHDNKTKKTKFIIDWDLEFAAMKAYVQLNPEKTKYNHKMHNWFSDILK